MGQGRGGQGRAGQGRGWKGGKDMKGAVCGGSGEGMSEG